MGNINPVNIEYFDSYAAELVGKFQRLRHLVKDNSASGNYHEEILRVALKNFLTKRYSVKTGFIYSDGDNVSNQMDIIIVDENSPAAYIFQEGDFAIVLPEAVVAVIEVKTTLDPAEYDTALKNIASAKSLLEFPGNHPGIIFGYQSDLRPTRKMSDTKADGWFKRDAAKIFKAAGKEKSAPDAIIWLSDNYSMLRYNYETKTIGDSYSYHSFKSPDEQIGWQISVVLAMIIGACEAGEFKRTRTFGNNQANKLLGMKLMEVSDDTFSLGDGILKKAVHEPKETKK